MIERAARNFPIDLESSWMIGDKAMDIETGFNAELKTALVLTGYGQKAAEILERKPDLITENLLEVVEIVVSAKL